MTTRRWTITTRHEENGANDPDPEEPQHTHLTSTTELQTCLRRNGTFRCPATKLREWHNLGLGDTLRDRCMEEDNVTVWIHKPFPSALMNDHKNRPAGCEITRGTLFWQALDLRIKQRNRIRKLRVTM